MSMSSSNPVESSVKSLRVVFMGTPEFAVASLAAILNSTHQVVGVVTSPDRPAGRGRQMRSSAVKEFAVQQGLKVLQPMKLRAEEFQDELRSLNADVFVVVAFRMLPVSVWSMPAQGTFNLHASLLPDYRGAAPINWAIINGETKTGMTTFFINEEIDKGGIILQKEMAIEAHDDAGSLHDRMMESGAQLVVKTLDLITTGELKVKEQNPNSEMHPAPKLNTDNRKIDWNTDANTIHNLIRGLSPYPCALSALHSGDNVWPCKLYHSAFTDEALDLKPGIISIIDRKRLIVGTENGLLEILDIQLSGKKRMKVKDLLNGLDLQKGAYFS